MYTNRLTAIVRRLLMARKSLTKDQKAEAIRQLKAGGAVSSVADAVGAEPEAIKKEKALKLRQSEATTTYGSVVTVRLSPEEVQQLDRLKDVLGTDSRSEVLRTLLRSSVGMLEFPPEQAAELEAIKHELHKIGVNINQIAFAANTRKIKLARGQMRALDDLRLTMPKVRTFLQAVVAEQRRRGVRLFKAFVEGEA
ncbi:plasmid mobilization relaxosome protein MobC [Paracoccus sp. M683]|uniref:plasmid mobilization relaxosome protein MobC n=2 Tax=Paracoccus TaxID=265 RepID=UPI00117C48EE|nr:plasmid mobilization relaxosome protein MobC [Paracoccus sp. M683]TRW93165.1 plasmid mobilization relaxosome protein MobC [Paracoccus sp. M683]